MSPRTGDTDLASAGVRTAPASDVYTVMLILSCLFVGGALALTWTRLEKDYYWPSGPPVKTFEQPVTPE